MLLFSAVMMDQLICGSKPSVGSLENIIYISCVSMESIEMCTILLRQEREIAFVKVCIQVLWMNPVYTYYVRTIVKNLFIFVLFSISFRMLMKILYYCHDMPS